MGLLYILLMFVVIKYGFVCYICIKEKKRRKKKRKDSQTVSWICCPVHLQTIWLDRCSRCDKCSAGTINMT